MQLVIRRMVSAGPEKVIKVIALDGSIHSIKDFEFKDERLRNLVNYEFSGKERIDAEIEGKKPKYLHYLIENKYFERELRSDAGHWRAYPKGVFLEDQIKELYRKIAREIGAFPISNSNVFDLAHKGIKKHAEGYGDRLYQFKFDNKNLVLKFAACHGQFSFLSDKNISVNDLPLKVYEFADSYRLEQRGELCYYRSRKFLLPDLHVFCKDLGQAKEYLLFLEKELLKQIKDEDQEYRIIYNVSESFLKKEMQWLKERVKEHKHPIILDIREDGKYYWVLNIEYCINDALNRPVEIATLQIDVGNSRMFDIKYFEGNKKEYSVIIHSAIIGSLQRWIYMLFDKAVKMEKQGKPAMLPVWVIPEQVRILPIADRHINKASEMGEELKQRNVRVCVDDRKKSLDKKVFEANKDWVPYVIVIGDKEVNKDEFKVRIREERSEKVMSLEGISNKIKKECRGINQLESYLPIRLSEHPSFV